MLIDRVEKQIKDIKQEIEVIREEIDNSDVTHFSKFSNLQTRLREKMDDLSKAETFLSKYQQKAIAT